MLTMPTRKNMLPQNKSLKPLAKNLRNNATRHENQLWYKYLRTYPLPFNRQMIIMNYIADFYCAKAHLVIELDGSQHYDDENIARDAKREEALRKLNLEILRFSNLDIDRNFPGVCEQINQTILERTNRPAVSGATTD